MGKTGITIYDCDGNEARLFRQYALITVSN